MALNDVMRIDRLNAEEFKSLVTVSSPTRWVGMPPGPGNFAHAFGAGMSALAAAQMLAEEMRQMSRPR